MRLAPILVVAALAGAAPATAAERVFPVGGFDRVESKGAFDVRIHTGAAPAARATGEREMLDSLTLDVRDGVLVIGDKGWHWRWGAHTPTVIDVSAPMIRGMALAGSGNMVVDAIRTRAFAASLAGSGKVRIGTIQVESVALILGGSGDLTAAGHARRSTLVLRGSGDLRTGALTALDTDITLGGSGNVAAAATRSAQVKLLGVGNVTVTGGARCTTTKSGIGTVQC